MVDAGVAVYVGTRPLPRGASPLRGPGRVPVLAFSAVRAVPAVADVACALGPVEIGGAGAAGGGPTAGVDGGGGGGSVTGGGGGGGGAVELEMVGFLDRVVWTVSVV